MSIQPDDGRLTGYLLGTLPEEEREHLDELSIVDDDVALRLRVAEDDLIDAYVRGQLEGETLERFKREYLATPERRRRVQFAEVFLRGEKPSRRGFGWAIAASIVVAAIVAGYVVATRDDAPRPAVPEVVARTQPVQSVSILLLPPTRQISTIPALQIPGETKVVNVQLQLEADDYPRYSAALRDLAADQIVWRAESLTSAPNGVAFDIPASVLTGKRYSVELSGVPPEGRPEIIASYAFEIQNSS